jgi:hypothetical protein
MTEPASPERTFTKNDGAGAAVTQVPGPRCNGCPDTLNPGSWKPRFSLFYRGVLRRTIGVSDSSRNWRRVRSLRSRRIGLRLCPDDSRDAARSQRLSLRREISHRLRALGRVPGRSGSMPASNVARSVCIGTSCHRNSQNLKRMCTT